MALHYIIQQTYEYQHNVSAIIPLDKPVERIKITRHYAGAQFDTYDRDEWKLPMDTGMKADRVTLQDAWTWWQDARVLASVLSDYNWQPKAIALVYFNYYKDRKHHNVVQEVWFSSQICFTNSESA